MGYLLTRLDNKCRTRYMAVHRDLRGRKRSAGTFSTEKKANEAWQKAEFKQSEGRLTDWASMKSSHGS